MFITFEGIEGCGKSTQAKRLVNRLKKLGIPLVFTLEPGGTQIGRDIRRILLDSQNKHISPLAELFLYEADRAQHIKEVIQPALQQDRWVVCDRFSDATVVYQGYARGQDISLIAVLNKKACLDIRPDFTFLLDCPVEVGLERALKRTKLLKQDGQDRFEREEKNFHEAIRQGYLSMAGENSKRFIVVDGTLEEDELEEVIFRYIRPLRKLSKNGFIARSSESFEGKGTRPKRP